MVNPGTVLGPMIPPAINASMAMFCRLLQGNLPLLARVGKKLNLVIRPFKNQWDCSVTFRSLLATHGQMSLPDSVQAPAVSIDT